jgi:hypothetical protein
MAYPGYLGARERTYAIKRVRLLSGEQWVKGEGVASIEPPPGVYHSSENSLRRPTWARSAKVALDTTNQYGYTSASAAKFPEAFKPVDTKFWQPMSSEETLDIHQRQAAANLKATFTEDSDKVAIGSTVADADYSNAQVQRNIALRRRKLSRPATWEEKERREREERKMPLTRRYATGESAFRESSAIVKTGPLDTPVLVNGLPTVDKGGAGPGPAKLRLKRNKRLGAAPQPDETQSHAEISLPTFNPNSAPKAKLIGPTRNGWGLLSRSEMMYPEAYRDLSTVYWKKLTDQERRQVDTVQARAMEKAGYERGTDKQFMQEIFEDDNYVFKGGGRMDDTNRTGSGWSAEAAVAVIILLIGLGVLAWYALQSTDGFELPAPSIQPALDED